MNPRISEGSFAYYTDYEFKGFPSLFLILPSILCI